MRAPARVGIEALSRGAAHVTFVERDRRAQALIAENLAHCGIDERLCYHPRNCRPRASTTLRRSAAFEPFDIILLDPPYDRAGSDDGARRRRTRLLAPGGVLVLEHARRGDRRRSRRDGLVRDAQTVVSGDSALTFYACQP